MVRNRIIVAHDWQRKVSLLIVFFFLLIRSKSQPIQYSKWELQFSTPIYSKAELRFTSGPGFFKSSFATSFEINLFRHLYIREHHAISIQAGIGKMAYKIDYEFLKEKYPEIPFSITREKHTDRFYDLRRFAFGYAYFFSVNAKLSGALNITTGIRQTPSTRVGFYYDIINPDGSTFYVMSLESQSANRLITQDAELRLTGYYLLGKRIHLSGCLFARYSFTEQVSGRLVIFPNTASRTTGTFSLSGSCAGFCVGIGI
jgi:hypothetical protein